MTRGSRRTTTGFVIMAALLVAGHHGMAKSARPARMPTPTQLEKRFELRDPAPGTVAEMLMANAKRFKLSCPEANMGTSIAWAARVTKKLGPSEYQVDLELHRPMSTEHHPAILHTTLSTFSSGGIVREVCVLGKHGSRKVRMETGFDSTIMVFVEDPRPPVDEDQNRFDSAYAEVLNSFPGIPTPAPTDCTSPYLGGNVWCFGKSTGLYPQNAGTPLWAAETFVPLRSRETVNSPSDCFNFFEKTVPGAAAVAHIDGGARETEYRFYLRGDTLYTAEWRGPGVSDGPCHFVACIAGGRRPARTSSQVNTWVTECTIPPHAKRLKDTPASDSRTDDPWDQERRP